MPNTWVTPHATIVSTIRSETVRSAALGAGTADVDAVVADLDREAGRRVGEAGGRASRQRVVVVAVPRAAQQPVLDRPSPSGPPWCGQWLSSARRKCRPTRASAIVRGPARAVRTRPSATSPGLGDLVPGPPVGHLRRPGRSGGRRRFLGHGGIRSPGSGHRCRGRPWSRPSVGVEVAPRPARSRCARRERVTAQRVPTSKCSRFGSDTSSRKLNIDHGYWVTIRPESLR